jgi:hypothetical protein
LNSYYLLLKSILCYKPYHNTFQSFHDKLRSWESALRVVNRLQAGWHKSRSSIRYRGKRFFASAKHSDGSRVNSAFHSLGTGYVVLGKCLGCEVDHLFHGVAKVKDGWSSTSSLQCALMTCKAINVLLTLHRLVSFEIWILTWDTMKSGWWHCILREMHTDVSTLMMEAAGSS